jgi:multidrug efflux system outer membrane protein
MTAALLLLLAVPQPSPTAWWRTYGDPELTRIVEKVASSNLDLRSAAARIAESRAAAGERRSALGPSINFTTGAQRLRGGFAQGIARIPQNPGDAQSGAFVSPFETGLIQGQLDMRWELDLFGTNRASLAAARADASAEQELRGDVLIAVTAEAARNYLELRGIEERLAIARESLATQKDLLGLTEDRARAGLASQLDVERQAVLVANTESAIPGLEAERSVRLHRIAVLTGDFGFAVQPGSNPITLPRTQSAAVTADVLKRRPDVRAAETRILAAAARLKQARSDRYPKIALSGLAGRQGTSVSGLSFGGGNFFSIGPQLQMPIFNYGRIRSNIDASDARLERERAAFESEVLSALEEANNALANYRRQQEREAALANAERAAQTSLDLSADLNKAGLSDFLAVLDAQRSLLDARDQRAAARTQSLVQSVALYKALAGGWPR